MTNSLQVPVNDAERADLKERACAVLGHRTDTPCQATFESLLVEAVARLEQIRDAS
jgi:hypothetical protein